MSGARILILGANGQLARNRSVLDPYRDAAEMGHMQAQLPPAQASFTLR